MSHHHHHSTKGMTVAFWLNAIFTLIEFAGGIYTNSSSILTDAIHDLGDSIAIGAGIWLEKISGQKRTLTFSYGYKRFSLLSALILASFLLGGSLVMLIRSIEQLFTPHVVKPEGMLWLAVLGIVVNGLAFLRLNKKDAHHHDHKHESHDHHDHHHEEEEHHNSRAIALHLLEDVLGWIAVLIGAIVIYYTNWNWIDPVLSILIAVFIIVRAIPTLRNTLRIFLQSVPENFDSEKLSQEILRIEGVQGLHDMHAWTMEGNYNVFTLHVVIATEFRSTEKEIRQQIETILKKYKIHHTTLQIETEGEGECQLLDC
jgi:cobalt-zinc-cadmium efflux system protein